MHPEDEMSLSPETSARIRFLKAPKTGASADAIQIEATVKEVLAAVRSRGDEALRDYSRLFDKVEIDRFEVSMDQREAAVADLDQQTLADTRFAIERVRAFAEAQMGTILPLEVEPMPGLHLGHRVIPIERVGAYVPGGRYPLLSAPVMTIVPAKVAGCDEVIACMPPNAHRAMIAACHLAGAAHEEYAVGPGNAYVNEAKRQVFGPVGIDQLAGPSEIFVVADESGDAGTIATDLLAQAEHDVRTRVGLITTDAKLAADTLAQVERQLLDLPTAGVAEPAWRDFGQIVVCENEAAMIAYSDHIAAEHLQVHTLDPQATALKLRNYGSLFIGPMASVVYSDKCCGTNHTLPTMGAARYTGGLWVGSYVKICTHQRLDRQGVEKVAPPAIRQSASEGLEGHRRAAAMRLDRLQST
jgi:histidinol dehydrogenase/sulfopropanediol 3-dehydrogenase